MKKFILRPSSVILLLLALAGTAVFLHVVPKYLFLRYTIPQADKQPDNNPANCTAKRPGQKRAVFIGDSITMGTVSGNYVDMLAERLDAQQFDLVNAGINSQLAYNVLQRLDKVIACDPDFVFVLIGTNDVNAVVLEGNAEGYITGQNLPQTPTAAWYRENMTAIATKLKTETAAHIVLLSLPTIGELPDSPAYQLSAKYSAIVKEVAEDTAVTYLPLHETMDTYLRQQPGPRTDYSEDWLQLVNDGIRRHFLYRQSLNAIGQRNGFLLHTDPLHLNTTGATLIADIIQLFLEKE